MQSLGDCRLRDAKLGKKCMAKPCHCLQYWEEAVGSLEDVRKEDGLLKAKISRIIVILPLGLEETLEPLLGHRIAILRTDIPGKDYLCRVIPEMEDCPKAAQRRCRDEQIPITVR